MLEALKTIGIRESMLQFILALYSSPTGKVQVNGHLLNAFTISNGACQGCPLSPLIFVLTLEPLLQCLRLDPDIKGVTISPTTSSYSSLNHTLRLPKVLKDFTTFKTITNFQINLMKSLNISLENDTLTQCQTNFPFKWSQDSITYLGIQLHSKLSNMYTKNYLLILQNIQKDLTSWSNCLFSWFGRASIVKMNILPRILYVLQAVPIKLLQAFFASVCNTCTVFVWGKLHPRLSFERQTLPQVKIMWMSDDDCAV